MNWNNVVTGDCLTEMKQIPNNEIDLIFADPPYNIGYSYDVYNDDLPATDYLFWVQQWIKECRRVLRPGGAFWLMCHSSYMGRIEDLLHQRSFNIVNRVIWRYTFGQAQKTKFTPSWVPLFYCVKTGSTLVTFNADAIRVPSARQIKYNDIRANPKGKVPDDVWDDIPRLCGTFKERTDHPCQLPEKLLERIILACTNKDDRVFDPFAGSGTTLAVAKRLGRKYLGVELSPAYAKAITQRLAGVITGFNFQ